MEAHAEAAARLAEAAADRASCQTVSHDTRLAVGDFVYVQNRGAGHAKLQEQWRPGLQVVMTQPFAETQVYHLQRCRCIASIYNVDFQNISQK